jgi:hypothetical protein
MIALVPQHPISDFGFRPSFGFRISVFGFVALAVALIPTSLQACAACYGQSDAPMAAGMNWGILSLLMVIVVVLGAVAAFFVYLARRSASMAMADRAKPALIGSADASWAQQRNASVLGGPRVRREWFFAACRRVGRIGHCCGWGGAHSGAVALGGTRKITPEVN